MNSWWEFGEWSGLPGLVLSLREIECPFCRERGSFETVHSETKKKPNGRKTLYFDTLKCGSCASFVLVFWSASEYGGLYNYHVLPWPIGTVRAPEFWPIETKRFWTQAHSNIHSENWDAAAQMARSALQVSLRQIGAQGNSLKSEIDDLASKGLLPPSMKDWSHVLREIGNESAHPRPGDAATSSEDALDIVRFLDFLLQYLFTIPKEIEDYRNRKKLKL
jgi:Domain of unknown function (DUF4145)